MRFESITKTEINSALYSCLPQMNASNSQDDRCFQKLEVGRVSTEVFNRSLGNGVCKYLNRASLRLRQSVAFTQFKVNSLGVLPLILVYSAYHSWSTRGVGHHALARVF